MEPIDHLQNMGIDTVNSIHRFGGNQELYLRFLQKFPEDENFQGLFNALQNQDQETALFHAHTLKGVAANLGFTTLSSWADQMVRAFRSGQPQEASKFFSSLRMEYERVCAILSK